jgi:hypothetical protein
MTTQTVIYHEINTTLWFSSHFPTNCLFSSPINIRLLLHPKEKLNILYENETTKCSA